MIPDERDSISDCIAVGNVLRAIPRETIDRALVTVDRTKRREGPFPDYLVVYFVILMSMFADLSYIHVYEKFRKSFQWLSFGVLRDLTDSAITQGRQRLGPAVMKALFKLIAKPQTYDDMPSAYYKNWRVVAIDGVVFALQDTPRNEAEFGRAVNRNGSSGFPQMRCVVLIECATRLILDLVSGPFSGKTHGEKTMAEAILPNLEPDMLCLADRLYPSYELCEMALKTGAQFLWRVGKSFKLTPIKHFKDGSYTAKLYCYDEVKKLRSSEALTVRVIEYTVEGVDQSFRLITSILDPEAAPADELAHLYPQRWTEETLLGDIKSTMRSKNLVFRSKSPEMVEQELYGFIIAHQILRHFMLKASQESGIPPGHFSFTHTIFVVRENIHMLGNLSPRRS